MCPLKLLTFACVLSYQDDTSIYIFIFSSKNFIILFHLTPRSYLFGDVVLVQGEAQDVPNDAGNEGAPQDNAANPANPLNLDGDLGAAHQALVQREGPTGFQPYNRPNLFPLRVSFLIQSCRHAMSRSL
jgi:hypothetical protein